MLQDRESCAQADRFGRENVQRIAQAIGATIVNRRQSNVARYKGRKVVLKSARFRNQAIGVPYTVLAHVQTVIAAFEEEPNHFAAFELPAEIFRRHQKPQPNGTTAQVPKAVFLRHGKEIGDFAIEPSLRCISASVTRLTGLRPASCC